MKIGVLSDSHIPRRAKALSKIILDVFEDVDHIVHAGDITDIAVIQQLENSRQLPPWRGMGIPSKCTDTSVRSESFHSVNLTLALFTVTEARAKRYSGLWHVLKTTMWTAPYLATATSRAATITMAFFCLILDRLRTGGRTSTVPLD